MGRKRELRQGESVTSWVSTLVAYGTHLGSLKTVLCPGLLDQWNQNLWGGSGRDWPLVSYIWRLPSDWNEQPQRRTTSYCQLPSPQPDTNLEAHVTLYMLFPNSHSPPEMDWIFLFPPSFPKTHLLKPKPPRCSREVGLWEVIRSWEWSFMNGISALTRGQRASYLSSHWVETHREESRLQPGKRTLSRLNHADTPVSDLQPPEPREINFCC